MFITFEGIDGAGKSTQIRRLQRRLEASGLQVVCTREPGGTIIGDEVRRLLLDAGSKTMAHETEVLLYAASRAQLLHEVIRPALASGQVVLCDRYVDASIAYQGAGLGVGIDIVARINAFATRGLRPNCTFLFDLPVPESRQRVQKSRGEVRPDRIEQRDDAYFHCVRDAFLRIAENEPERVVVLDATQPPDVLEQEIWRQITKLTGIS
ncbi:dTMP kinase [Alicyclobacillus cycloheptanicus]|uniref:Thymidylate kinase n=1 Tax=Alicyclobacillus cycloheptanicus TaxID=1457 RepID=A0ABT9XIS7_9BACL|nr:dTMP kinase [Alicyclobacillus cycloheptanicus]